MDAESSKKVDLQKKFMEIQALDNSMKKINEQIIQLNTQIEELMMIQQNIDEFKSVEEGKEILFPLANGIFAKATLKKSDFIVTVGSGIAVEKSQKETKTLLDEQVQELIVYKMQLENQISSFSQKIIDLQKEIQKN